MITECTNSSRVIIKKLYLVPTINREMPGFPFSASFFLQCFTRLMNRDNHETLDNSDPVLTTQILFMFFKMYYREKFDMNFLRQHDLSMFMRVPLTADCNRLNVPQELEDHILDILKDTKKG